MAKRVIEVQLKTKGQKEADKMNKSMARMGRVAAGATRGVMALTTAILAAAGVSSILAGVLAKFIVSISTSAKELETLARQAKLNTDEFKSLAFATDLYGVSAEQIADISKDVADKVGEFTAAGTGAFQDYVDVMGYTKNEAMEVAAAFSTMSGDAVIGEMVRQMEAAGASGNEMTFVLESMGSDLSRLLPLFTNNSAALTKITTQYESLTGHLQLSAEQMAALNDVTKEYNTSQEIMNGFLNQLGARVAPWVSEKLEGINSWLSEMTQSALEWVDAMAEAEGINLPSQEGERPGGSPGGAGGGGGGETSGGLTPEQLQQYEALKTQLERERYLMVLDESLKTQIVENGLNDRVAAEMLAREQRLIAVDAQEEEILAQMSEAQATELGLLQEFENTRQQIVDGSEAEIARIRADAARQQMAAQIATASNFLNNIARLNTKSKGLQRLSIVANTADAVVKSFNNAGGYPWGVVPAGIMAAIGAKQLSQVGKSTVRKPSGGNAGGDSAGIGSPTVTSLTQVNNVESTALLELRNELARRDPDEPLSVEFTRRLMASMNDQTLSGAA